MKVFHWRPTGALVGHVDRIWGWEASGPKEVRLPVLVPGTGAEVFFHYRSPFVFDDPSSGRVAAPAAHLVCARRKVVKFLPSTDVGFVAVRFRAGAIHRFTAVPARELADSMMSAEELWGASARRLSKEVRASEGFAERVEAIQRFLSGLLAKGRGDELVEEAIRRTYYGCAEISIAALANSLAISRRQLERRVSSVTDQTLVEIRSTSRFQKVVRDMLLDRTAGLLDTLLKHGFYDQSHFSRYCRRLGLGPPGAVISAARGATHFYNPPRHGRDSLRRSS